MKKYDFVSLGDITTDSFIRLREDHATVECAEDGRPCKICMNFGDKIPYEFVEVVRAVGNSPNAAVSASRLGLNAALATNLGDDENGRECIKSLEGNNVATEFVKVHAGKKTNHHYVLWYKAERTILIKHEEYLYEMPDIGEEGWVYLSSLGENSIPFHHEIARYISGRPNLKVAFQPGTFQIKLGYEELGDIYKISEVFFCNLEEAKRILHTDEIGVKTLLAKMHELGPKIVVITDGPKGAYAYHEGGVWHMPPYPDPKEPVDRTGAGDSFSSTFVTALALGKDIPEALRWAPVNSMSVVQKIGAQKGLLSRETLEEYLANAPENYAVKKLS